VEYVSVAEAAAELGLNASTIRKRISTGQMRAQRLGERSLMISRREVERWRKIGKLPPGRISTPTKTGTARRRRRTEQE
jgi:excisionase family DNA binding protein